MLDAAAAFRRTLHRALAYTEPVSCGLDRYRLLTRRLMGYQLDKAGEVGLHLRKQGNSFSGGYLAQWRLPFDVSTMASSTICFGSLR